MAIGFRDELKMDADEMERNNGPGRWIYAEKDQTWVGCVDVCMYVLFGKRYEP